MRDANAWHHLAGLFWSDAKNGVRKKSGQSLSSVGVVFVSLFFFFFSSFFFFNFHLDNIDVCYTTGVCNRRRALYDFICACKKFANERIEGSYFGVSVNVCVNVCVCNMCMKKCVCEKVCVNKCVNLHMYICVCIRSEILWYKNNYPPPPPSDVTHRFQFNDV